MERHAMVRSLSHTSMWLTWHRSWFGFTVNSIWITVTLIWVNHTGSCSVNYHRCIIQRQLNIRSVWIVSVRLKWGCAILSTAALQGEWEVFAFRSCCYYCQVRAFGKSDACQSMAQERSRGATPRPRSGAVAEGSYPTSKVEGGGRQELSRFQGKEQQLRFAGAAVKR